MDNVLHTAREVAANAAVFAGKLIKEHFATEYEVSAKGNDGDVVTEVDLLAETAILTHIQKRFPEHQIRSEEAGVLGADGDWMWSVDPLDGTNNFALGLPVYGVCLTLFYRKEPVIGVIYEPHLDNLYVAERGRGATCNGRVIRVECCHDARKMTVGWIQGHQVQKEQAAMQLKQRLEAHFKRVLSLWAPSLVWCMLARGDLDGIVLYNSEGEDLYGGLLMLQEAGGAVMNFDGSPFRGVSSNPYIVACHPDNREILLTIVKEGLQV